MKTRVTSDCIEKLKEKLVDYIDEHSGINRNKKFRCFNCRDHNNEDKNFSAALVPKSNSKHWKCFACDAKGDIFRAVEYKEGIVDFYSKLKFVSRKYSIPLEYEDI
jgi:hypothetical protein